MEFKDSFIATAIGSFPDKEEKEVFPLILRDFPCIPFWPQFPRRSYLEGMVAQYSGGFPSLKLDKKEQSLWVDSSSGFEVEVEKFYQAIEKEDIEFFRISEDVKTVA